MHKKIICVDFDGVIHSYDSGWNGVDVILDAPVLGALTWINDLTSMDDFDVQIYSSRSQNPKGVDAMIDWLSKHDFPVAKLSFPTQKPPAWLTIDDRAICFKGTFPTADEMRNFKPWNKK